jgi:hypothetical protein
VVLEKADPLRHPGHGLLRGDCADSCAGPADGQISALRVIMATARATAR